MIGTKLGHFQILEPLGEGGMGKVYVALDLDLKRKVALKLLPAEFATNEERLRRFQTEAESVAKLNHPNIVTVFSVFHEGDQHFLAMELVEGQTLADTIPDGGLELDRFLDLAGQLLRGVAAAHQSGVVHRDLKPANVMVDSSGQVKVLDFGLAKLRGTISESELDDQPTLLMTQEGQILGTPAYMAPEQAAGRPADTRTDVFAVGAILYRMLTGNRAFKGDSAAALQAAVLSSDPDAPSSVRGEIPEELNNLVVRCLAKKPDDRPESAIELARELEEFSAQREKSRVPMGGRGGRRALIAAAALVAIIAVGVGWLLQKSRARERLRTETLPEIARLVDERQNVEALLLAQKTSESLPDDSFLADLLERATTRLDVTTVPDGAEVSFQSYQVLDSNWHALGLAPLDAVALPALTFLRFRIAKEGYQTLEVGIGPDRPSLDFELKRLDETPAGMKWVPAGPTILGLEARRKVPGFWLDELEVTNAQFAEFVRAGGYAERELWPDAFEADGRTLSFKDAIARMVDATGRPGPSTWQLGTFPEGKARHPVAGVSWFEASAFCSSAGKALPTAHHWRRSAPYTIFGDMFLLSNTAGTGDAPVGSSRAVAQYGHADLAGNVSEWTATASADGTRIMLGGSWVEPAYRFADQDGQAPFQRGVDFGFRCALYPGPIDPELLAPVVAGRYDFADVTAVRDETFERFRRLYDYDKVELDARREDLDESSPHWRRETVSFTPAYDGERMLAHLFLPRDVEPPYQTVVWVPGSNARFLTSVDQMLADRVLFLTRSGRALVLPAYFGMLERGGARPRDTSDRGMRDGWVKSVNDLQRTIDYLETRPEINSSNLGYLGLSLGAEYGPLFNAIEQRFKAIVFLAGGYDDLHMLQEPEEVNPWHYAPRVRAPVLMVNGKNDYGLPVETGQKPLLEDLGAPDEDKHHVLLEGGHMPVDWNPLMLETLRWFDRYLGPVR